MANLRETSTWETGIYQWETSDPVMGGENGIDNRPTRQLANRTLWLKNEIARAIALIGTNQTSMGNITISVGAGLTGGGNLTANRTIGLATPSTLSGSTTNWVGNGATGHTHQLAAATSQIAGVVKLIDNLTTDDGNVALSAKQGKNLLDTLKSMGYDNLDKGVASRAGIDLNTLTAHGSVTYVNYDGTNIAKTLPEWWQKYNLPSAETRWGVVLVYRESASIVYQLFLTALGQVWFRFRSLSNSASTFNKRGWVRLDGADWESIRDKPNNLATYGLEQEVSEKISQAVPSGTIVYYGGRTIPKGWIAGNGAALSRTVYADLFAVFGTTYGAGDGVNTFNIPDLRGEFGRFWDNGRGVDAGRGLGSFQNDAFQGHARNLKRSQSDARIHGLNYFQNVSVNNSLNSPAPAVIGEGDNWHTHDYLPHLSYGEPRVAAETRPRNIALMGIIKV